MPHPRAAEQLPKVSVYEIDSSQARANVRRSLGMATGNAPQASLKNSLVPAIWMKAGASL